ncbi:MAG: DUF481 domain-containing protein [Myxococcota bacterium]
MIQLLMATPLAVHLGVAGSSMAAAQAGPAMPDGTVPADPATTGATEIGNQGTFATAEDGTAQEDQEEEESTDATELEISAGGIYSTGNARLLAITGLGRFRLRRERHQFRTELAGNYGRTAVDPDADPETSVANVQGLMRYDFFFHPRFSAFLMGTARHDRFQGLDLRLNIDPGIAAYAIQKPDHRLWFEVGYDFQYDLRRDDARVDAENGVLLPKTAVNHAARVFAGYSNNLSEYVTFDTGLEYLQSVLVARRFRINWLSSLTTQLVDRVSVGLTFALRYENQPLPDVRPLDTITSILLGVRFI